MGLFQKAVETYDYMEKIAGKEIENRIPLAPIGFISTDVQILITLTDNGDFLKAERVYDDKTNPKGKIIRVDKKIIVPATQKSAGRSGTSAKVTPHPLHDKLFYMCPDNIESYRAYVVQLSEWCNSENTVPKICAVLAYIQKGSIRSDLGSLEDVKDDDFVCWKVLSSETSEPEELWKCQSVINSYIDFSQSKVNNEAGKALCYINGQTLPIAEQHLKGIVSLFGNAKLISSNDSINYTYKGRFITDAEALTVSFEASQKAHNALKWIAANDGIKIGDRVMICWNPRGQETPKLHLSIFKGYQGEINPTNYRDVLAKIINGYKSGFEPSDQTVIAIFEAATTGRLSLGYYSEMKSEDFLERIKYWDESCVWLNGIFGVSSPNLYGIADAAYGTIRHNDNVQTIETEEKVKSEITQRLVLCRVEKSLFPGNIMRSAVQKCAFLQQYDNSRVDGKPSNRDMQLFTTCAIIKKYRFDHFKEEWKMALEPDMKNRSYQYGRLLAVMEKAERDTYDKNENREPNAIRMQPLFVKRPMYATKLLLEQIKNAYYPRLSVGERIFYEKLIGQIMLIISDCSDINIDKSLTEEYLLGYYLQKNDFYTKKNNKTDEQEGI